jgi:hypothetical protein
VNGGKFFFSTNSSTSKAKALFFPLVLLNSPLGKETKDWANSKIRFKRVSIMTATHSPT